MSSRESSIGKYILCKGVDWEDEQMWHLFKKEERSS